MQGFPGIFVIY